VWVGGGFEGLTCAEVNHLDQLHFHNMKDYFQFKIESFSDQCVIHGKTPGCR